MTGKGRIGTSMTTFRIPKSARKKQRYKPPGPVDATIDPKLRLCPVCQATAGKRCRDEHGQALQGMHPERRTSSGDPGPLPKKATSSKKQTGGKKRTTSRKAAG